MNTLARRIIQRCMCQITAIAVLVPASALVFPAQAGVPLPPDQYKRAPEFAPETDPAKLVQDRRCFVCHDMTRGDRLGPPFKAVAIRYANANEDVMADVLAQKIIGGGGLNWGNMVMVPNTRVSWDEARVIARWILNLKPAADATQKPDK